MRLRSRGSRRLARLSCPVLAMLLSVSAVKAQHPTPFQIRQQNPLTLIYGLPLPRSAVLPQAGEQRWYAGINVSNTLHMQNRGNESLLIDGETTVIDLVADIGLRNDFAINVHVPVISHQAGTLDAFIEDFHDAFGLPQGNRLRQPRDRLLFSYTVSGEQRVRMDSATSGLGDIAVSAGAQLVSNEVAAASLWFSLKLPTGSSSKLTGSGAVDAAFWGGASRRLTSGCYAYGRLGALLLQRGDVAPRKQSRQVAFGMLGVSFRPWRWLNLQLQVDANTSFYDDTNTRVLSDAVQLTTGASIDLVPHWRLDLGVAEDVKVESAPDVHFHIGLGYSPQQ